VTLDILITGQRYLISDAIAVALNAIPGLVATAIHDDAASLVCSVQRSRPAVVVLGEGKAELAVLKSLAELRILVPSCAVIVLAGEPSSGFVRRAVAAGALSVVSDQARLAQLVSAVRGVATGCLTIDSSLLSVPKRDRCSLTEREREILSLTASGASTKEIAKELNLAAGTVRNLTSGVMKKLEGRNRFDAARIATLQGRL
jgi:two-component system response regulator DesR